MKSSHGIEAILASLLLAAPFGSFGAAPAPSTPSGQQKLSSACGQAATQASGRQVQGQITEVSRLSNDLYLLDPSTSHVVVITLNPTSEILQGGRRIGLKDLKEGETARVSYLLADQQMLALRVEVGSGCCAPAGRPTGGGQTGNLGGQECTDMGTGGSSFGQSGQPCQLSPINPTQQPGTGGTGPHGPDHKSSSDVGGAPAGSSSKPAPGPSAR